MNLRRRAILATGVGTTATALAGCGMLDDDTEADEQSDDDTQSDDDSGDGTGQAAGWHSFQGTAGNTGQGSDVSFSSEPSERFSVSFDGIESQPAVADGIVYLVTTDERLHAVGSDAGETLWTESVRDAPSQCPCVTGDVVCVGTESGDVVAFDMESGDREWTVTLGGEVAGLTPFAGTVYTGTDSGTIVGIDSSSGDVVFETERDRPVGTYPAVTADRLYVGVGDYETGHSVLGFDRSNGDLAFEVEARGARAVSATEETVTTVTGANLSVHLTDEQYIAGSSGTAIPVVASDVVFTGGRTVSTLSIGRNAPEWTHTLYDFDSESTVRTPMTASETQLYASYERPEPTLFALDRATGNLRWERPLPDGSPTGAVPAEDALFIGMDTGELLALE